MSLWNHSLCDKCYQAEEPGRMPVRLIDPDDTVCCRCRSNTSSGIYYRTYPDAYGGECHEAGK